MIRPTLVAGRYRHIVIPGEARQRPRVVDIATSRVSAAAVVERPCNLSLENTELLEWLFGQAGLDVRRYRTETLKRRLPACLRSLRVRSCAEARRLLEHEPSLVSIALDSMLVGVTWFFRDVPVFDMLRELVLPSLVEGRKSLHAWSVGCSDGAELYSLAMLLAEMGLLDSSYLLGSDCRAEAIRRCRLGRFDAETVQWVPPAMLERCFVRESSAWQVVPSLRTALRWKTADVLKTPEPGVWDVILCRNTAMYLRIEAMTSLWEQFEMLLRPGGILVLGKAERPVGTKRFSFLAPCIYRRNRG